MLSCIFSHDTKIEESDPVRKVAEICEKLDYTKIRKRLSADMAEGESENAVYAVGMRLYDSRIFEQRDRAPLQGGYPLYVDSERRAGAGSYDDRKIPE